MLATERHVPKTGYLRDPELTSSCCPIIRSNPKLGTLSIEKHDLNGLSNHLRGLSYNGRKIKTPRSYGLETSKRLDTTMPLRAFCLINTSLVSLKVLSSEFELFKTDVTVETQ
jgi:hypothetical protein